MTSRVGDILALVRQKLQADGIKLWLQPYHIDGLGICDEEIAVRNELISKLVIISTKPVCVYI